MMKSVSLLTVLVLAAASLGLVTSAVEAPARAQESLQLGISYVFWRPGYYNDYEVRSSLARVAQTGAGWISLTFNLYQDAIDSHDVYQGYETPSDEQLAHVITHAHDLGLRVMLKPHVNPIYDEGGHWRGLIGSAFDTEQDWERWFSSYRNMIAHYASLAEAHDVEQFCVGTELRGTTFREDDWRRLIADVRTRFSGPITYAANHGGEEMKITWWDAVDYIGVDAYYALSDHSDPMLEELVEAWEPHVVALAGLSSTWEKPILFTEIGYRSKEGSTQNPWEWVEAGVVDLQEQADAYQAAFESVFDQPWFAGMYWWAWDMVPPKDGPCDNHFTPEGKPAEDVLREWYGGPPRPVSEVTASSCPQPTESPGDRPPRSARTDEE